MKALKEFCGVHVNVVFFVPRCPETFTESDVNAYVLGVRSMIKKIMPEIVVTYGEAFRVKVSDSIAVGVTAFNGSDDVLRQTENMVWLICYGVWRYLCSARCGGDRDKWLCVERLLVKKHGESGSKIGGGTVL